MDTLTSEELFSAVNVIEVFSSTGNVNKVTVLVLNSWLDASHIAGEGDD